MKIIHISDNALGLPYLLLTDNPENLVRQIFEKHLDADLFLINVNYEYKENNHPENAGIWFLKYLRLYNICQHCVLYDFSSREQLIVEDTRNLIIFSKGITFIRLPEDLNQVDYQSLTQKKAPEDLSSFFKGEIILPEDERHNWANFWGIHRLWMVHKHIDPKFRDCEIEEFYSKGLKDKVNSYEGLALRYLYKHKDHNILSSLNEQSNNIENYINKVIKPKEFKIEQLLSSVRLQLQDTTFNAISLDNIKDQISQIKGILGINSEDPINVIFDQTENDEINIEDIHHLLSEIESQIQFYLQRLEYKTIHQHRKELKEKEPSIIYIDDQAEIGWSDIFQEIIYGEVNNNFNVIIPIKEDSVKDINRKIEVKISELIEKAEPVQIIMIDLRLKGEVGNIKINDISGVQVLNYILKHFPKIPVIVITASNKAKLYIHIKDNNPSPRGFWIKEGIDSRFDEKESVSNYTDLVFQLNSLIKNKDDYSRRLKTANTVKSAVNKAAAIRNIHDSKNLHYYSDSEIEKIIETDYFKQIQNKIIFKNIAVDTNYFFNATAYWKLKNNNEIVIQLQSFVLLANIYKKLKTNIIIPYKVLGEIILHGMTLTNYATPNIAARYSFLMLKRLLEEEKIIIDCKTGYVPFKLPQVLSTLNTYADPDIVKLFLNYRSSGDERNIALISDDYGIRNQIIEHFKSKRKWCALLKSDELNKILQPLIEYGESLNESIINHK